jgi:hypothetical protein
MTWAEVLAAFNFVVWLLPIIIRSWMAWRSPNGSRNILSDQELGSISGAVKRLNLRGKKLELNLSELDRAKADRDIQEGSK